MLRTQFFQAVRTVASTSQSVGSLHTSAVVHASRRQTSSVIRKTNILNQAKRAKESLADRPSVVLGTRPSEEAEKWRNCDLSKILVDEEALIKGETVEPVELPIGLVSLPQQFAFGVGEEEKEVLFDHLPRLAAQASVAPATRPVGSPQGILKEAHQLSVAEDREAAKANNFAKVVDLRNANAAGIAFENRRRIIIAFSSAENPFDPGRAEVQAALKTYQIRKLWNHLITYKRDVGNRLGLRKLVHQRAKILRYLRNTDRDRYETLLEQLALEPESVEGELVV